MSHLKKNLAGRLLPIPSSQAGYTLIELLVVIGLIAIVVLITFVSLDTGNEREQTRSVADNLRTDLKAQEESALANKVDSSGNPAGYYGILFGASVPFTKYSLVRLEKYPSTKAFDCTKANCNTTVTSTYQFSGPAVISAVSPNNLRAIFFGGTYATPIFYSSLGVINPATAKMTISGSGSNLTVSVSSVGTVSWSPTLPLDLTSRLGMGKAFAKVGKE